MAAAGGHHKSFCRHISKLFSSEDRAANVLLSGLARGLLGLRAWIDSWWALASDDVHALVDVDVNVAELLPHVVSLLDVETSLA